MRLPPPFPFSRQAAIEQSGTALRAGSNHFPFNRFARSALPLGMLSAGMLSLLPVNIQRRVSDKVATFFDCGHGQNEGTEDEHRGGAAVVGVGVFEQGGGQRGSNTDRR
jgi:hypothetical protein